MERTPVFINSTGDLQRFQPGDTVPFSMSGAGQKIRGNIGESSGTTLIPFDTTAPLSTEGTQLFSATITPQSLSSNIKINLSTMIDTSKTNLIVTVAIFRGTTLLGWKSAGSSAYNGSSPTPLDICINDTPGQLVALQYTARVGISASGTWYINRGATETMGGSNNLAWSVEEEL